ncbi:MAG: motility associated factor glycosyltransferase family protein [Spirochaetales bacterium]|nr:motility associated factor glycosyltransferase family protein [Spirochaetales bacterium]
MDKTNGFPQLVETPAGTTIVYNDVYLYSTRDPRKRPCTIIRQTEFLPQTLVFIPSIGLGYGISELLNTLPGQCHVLCMERDEKLMKLAKECIPADFFQNRNLTVVRADTPSAAVSVLNKFPPGMFRRVVSLTLCAGFRMDKAFYNQAELYLREKIQAYWKNRMTLIHMGRLYTRNLVDNTTILPHTRDISRLSLEKPVLVAGAGPSLEKSIGIIRAVRNDIIIIAVDTAVPVLCASNLYPDFILALEGQFINILDFLADIPDSVSLIADIASIPQAIRLFTSPGKHNTYLFSSAFHPLSIFPRMETAGMLPSSIPPLGSVGVTAVYLALRLTCHKVLVTGLDFSYPFSKSYSAGAPIPLQMLSGSRREYAVGQLEYSLLLSRPGYVTTDKAGKPLKSDMVLAAYAENVKTLAAESGRIIEISPFGMDLGGMKCYEAASLKNIFSLNKRNTGQIKQNTRFGATPESIISFIEKEQAMIGEAADKIGSILKDTAAESGVLTEEENKIFLKTDYAWFHLPHKKQFPDYSTAFLTQALLHYRYFEKRFARAKAALLRK